MRHFHLLSLMSMSNNQMRCLYVPQAVSVSVFAMLQSVKCTKGNFVICLFLIALKCVLLLYLRKSNRCTFVCRGK